MTCRDGGKQQTFRRFSVPTHVQVYQQPLKQRREAVFSSMCDFNIASGAFGGGNVYLYRFSAATATTTVYSPRKEREGGGRDSIAQILHYKVKLLGHVVVVAVVMVAVARDYGFV